MSTRKVHLEAETVRLASLTKRERDVTILVAEGLTNKQVAERLCVSPTTVRHHLTAIFRKLEVSNRFELIVFSYRHKLTVPPGPATKRRSGR